MVQVILAVLLGLVVGLIGGFLFGNRRNSQAAKEAENRAKDLVEKAQDRANEIKQTAKREMKQNLQEAREELEKEYKGRMQEVINQEKQIAKKELALDQKTEARDKELEDLKKKIEDADKKSVELDQDMAKAKQLRLDLADKLETVAEMTKDQAKQELITAMTEEAKVDAAKLIKRIEEEAHEDSEKKAKSIISIAMQRFAGEYVAETTIASVELASDEIKGRIIGREGRNIRAFEQICGVDLVIDDTPGVVVLSSFNVVRKEIARMTLERLIADGRIHPAKIEEFYEKSRVEIDSRLRELGEKAQLEIGVHGIHPEILKLIGALSYRTSYTQNQFQHALEVALIAGNIAAEFGLNVKQARRAGLLHDVGKVMDASAEGSHAVVGADFCKRYGEHPDIVHAIRAHHDDEKPETILAHIVAAADAISGARPGARKALMESYISRLTDIENIVNSFDGVARSYAISAGREVRVIVDHGRINDEQTVMLSRDIAKKLEQEMSYPGTIKVTVLRETRAVGVAR